MTGIHSMSFKRKVQHLSRLKYRAIPRTQQEIDHCAVRRCVRCGWRGMAAYAFSGPGWVVTYYYSRVTKRRYQERRPQYCGVVRRYAICDGCGYWEAYRFAS